MKLSHKIGLAAAGVGVVLASYFLTRPEPQHRQEAYLHYDFNEENIRYDPKSKTLFVKDISGNGNDGVVKGNIATTDDGLSAKVFNTIDEVPENCEVAIIRYGDHTSLYLDGGKLGVMPNNSTMNSEEHKQMQERYETFLQHRYENSKGK